MDGTAGVFGDLGAPRTGNAKRHLRPDILIIALCTVLCRGETSANTALFGRSKRAFLEEFLTLKHGIPSHDTFSRVHRILDLAGIPVMPRGPMCRKLGLLLQAQMARPIMPIEQRLFVRATRAVALQPSPYRVVIEAKSPRHLGIVPALVEQKNSIGSPHHPMGLTRMPNHRLQRHAFFGAPNSTVYHGHAKIDSRPDYQNDVRVRGDSEYIWKAPEENHSDGVAVLARPP